MSIMSGTGFLEMDEQWCTLPGGKRKDGYGLAGYLVEME